MATILMTAQIPGLPGPGGIPGIYTSDVTGGVVEWTSDWMLGSKDVDSILQYDETTLINPARSTVVRIFFTTQSIDALTIRDEVISELVPENTHHQLVDSGDYGDISYSLLTLVSDGQVYGSFILVNTSGQMSTATLILAPTESFAQGLTEAQKTLSVNYSPVLSGIDGIALQKQLQSAPAISIPVAATPDASAESETALVTSEAGDYEVAYPAEWQTANMEETDLEISHPDNTVTVSFAAIKNPGLTIEDIEAELAGPFMESLGPWATFVSSASDDNSAVIVADIDDTIVVQEAIILSPEMIILVTAFISGDSEEMLEESQEITVNGHGIFTLVP